MASATFVYIVVAAVLVFVMAAVVVGAPASVPDEEPGEPAQIRLHAQAALVR